MSLAAISSATPEAVLCKAFFNALEYLNLTHQQAGKVVGMDRTTVSRLKTRGMLSPETKQGELALLLIRIFRAVYALVGGDKEAIQHWLHTDNRHLNGVPAELINSVQGINRVVEYLDAIRGKV